MFGEIFFKNIWWGGAIAADIGVCGIGKEENNGMELKFRI